MFKPLIAIACAITLMGCKPDPNEAANALFVSTQSLMKDYRTTSQRTPGDLARQIELLNRIHSNVTQIVGEYSGSDLAVELTIGQVGDISPDQITSDLRNLTDEQACRAQLRTCVLSEALKDIQAVQSHDVAINGLISMAYYHDQQGQTVAAQTMLAAAEERLKKIQGDESYDSIANRVARFQASFGDHAAARATISGISDAHDQARALTKLALTTMEQNPNDAVKARDLMSQAHTIVSQSEKPVTRCWLDEADVMFEVRLGDFEAAGRRAAEIEDSKCAIDFLLSVARQMEQPQAAEKLLTQATNRVLTAIGMDRRYGQMVRITELRAKNVASEWHDSFEQTRKIARKDAKAERLTIFRQLFVIARNAGDLQLAREILEEAMYVVPTLASSDFMRVSKIYGVASSHIELGQMDAGLAVIDKNLTRTEAARAKIYLVYDMISRGDKRFANLLLDQAQTSAKIEPDLKKRTLILSRLAAVRLKNGDRAIATALASEVKKNLHMIPRYGPAHADVAVALFLIGETGDAMALLELSSKSYAYTGLTMRVISAVGSDAELDAVLASIRSAKSMISNPDFRAALMVGMIDGWYFRNYKADA